MQDENTEPFFLFVTGGAGTGKSHLIKCIHGEATKILSQMPRLLHETDITKPFVLLTSFTGTAAFNISGKTLHSVFKLPRSLKPPYRGLGADLDNVRAQLSDVQILVIDEISMVSKEILAYVDHRLQAIKGSRKAFGGVSILAVGDFYQLPPVRKSKPLCVYDFSFDMWHNNFKLFELQQIMRQREDVAFAQMLNRLRTKLKTDTLRSQDREMLQSVTKIPEDCPQDALHIFATNKECQEHNTKRLFTKFTDITTIEAVDYKKDPRTGHMARQPHPLTDSNNVLPDILQVSVGARIMLTRNIDVEDGLVNGSFGTVSSIIMKTTNAGTFVHMIGIEFDNRQAGLKFRNKVKDAPDTTVYIERFEEPLTKKDTIRRQFPMKLAYACTVHKVQGI